MALQDAAAEKVILNGETIIDVTETTATEEAVFSGRTFLGADGKAVTGTLKLPLQIVDDSGYLSLNKDKNTIYARYQSGADIDSINPTLFNRTPKTDEVFYALIKTNDDVYLPCYCQCTGVVSGNKYWTFKIIHLIAPDLTVQLSNKDLNDYINIGQFYFGAGGNACTNTPEGIDAFGMFVIRTAYGYYCQILISGNTPEQKIYTRTQRNVEGNLSWTEWICQTGALILEKVIDFSVPYNEIDITNYANNVPYTDFNRYPIVGDTFVLTGISSDNIVFMCKAMVTNAKNGSNKTEFKIENHSCTILYDPSGFNNRIKTLEDNTAGYATRTEAQGYATTAKTEAKAYADGLAGNYDAKGSAAQALTDAKAYTNEVKEALLGTEELNGTYDTLKEIGAWIENSGVDATELSGAIANEAKAREDADTGLMSYIEDEIRARKQADTDLEDTLTGKIDDSKTSLSQDIAAAKTASENYTDTEVTKIYNTVQQDIAGAINSQTEWTNNQLQSLYDDVSELSSTDATTKANTAETNAKTYTDQKLEDYYNKTEIDAMFEPASEGAVIRDENGDIIVPETPSSANAAISYAYAQDIGIANAIATRPYIREYAVANNTERDAKLSALLSGYGDATGEGPYRGDHVKITVTGTGLTHLYYYNQTNNRADLPGWIEIAQYYADLSARLQSLQNTDSNLYTKFAQLTCPIYGALDFSSILALVDQYTSLGGSILGGIEIVPYGTTNKYDFTVQNGTASSTFYKGPIQIIKYGNSGYTIIGDQCNSDGTISDIAHLRVRTYFKVGMAAYMSGAVTNASVYRPIICMK